MKDFWKRFRYNRSAVIGLVILVIVVAPDAPHRVGAVTHASKHCAA